MKKQGLVCILVALLGSGLFDLSEIANAEGVADNYVVIDVRADSNGKGVVYFEENLIGTPAACGAGYPNALAFDTNTVGGKTIFVLALSAKLSGTPIYAKGSGACAIYSNTIEDWRWGQ
jgi:hypothetical protein